MDCENSFTTPSTDRVTTSTNSLSAETSSAFAIATNLSNLTALSPRSITLMCVGLKSTRAARSSCVRFFASLASFIRRPTIRKSSATPPSERLLGLKILYLLTFSLYRSQKPSYRSLELILLQIIIITKKGSALWQSYHNAEP